MHISRNKVRHSSLSQFLQESNNSSSHNNASPSSKILSSSHLTLSQLVPQGRKIVGVDMKLPIFHGNGYEDKYSNCFYVNLYGMSNKSNMMM